MQGVWLCAIVRFGKQADSIGGLFACAINQPMQRSIFMCDEIVKSGLAVFSNPEFGNVRAVTRDGEPWFVAADVCRVLKHSNTSVALNMLDDDEKGMHKVYTPGGEQNMSVVNESGLYVLIFRSNLQKARDFRRWVTQEVLPAIRKTGKYEAPNSNNLPIPNFNNPVEAARAWADAVERGQIALSEKREFQQIALRDHSDVVFAKAIKSAKGATDVGGLAKIITQGLPIKIGRNQLYVWLRENGWLYKTGKNKFTPTQKSIEKGLMRIKINTVRLDKNVYTRPELQITTRGISFFFDQFSKWYLV